jgi:hypothetical protein
MSALGWRRVGGVAVGGLGLGLGGCPCFKPGGGVSHAAHGPRRQTGSRARRTRVGLSLIPPRAGAGRRASHGARPQAADCRSCARLAADGLAVSGDVRAALRLPNAAAVAAAAAAAAAAGLFPEWPVRAVFLNLRGVGGGGAAAVYHAAPPPRAGGAAGSNPRPGP